MELQKAKKRAEELIEEMKPFCDRIEIAGSIKREKPDVKDIELIALPKFTTVEEPSGNLFEPYQPVTKNLLWEWAINAEQPKWIKPGTSEIIEWQPKPDGKYWRGLLYIENDPVKLDLFLLNENNWGVISTIRTGPAEFSTSLVTFIKHKTPFRVQEGHLTIEETGEIIPCAEEEDFFRNAGLKFVPVSERHSQNAYSKLFLINV